MSLRKDLQVERAAPQRSTRACGSMHHRLDAARPTQHPITRTVAQSAETASHVHALQYVVAQADTRVWNAGALEVRCARARVQASERVARHRLERKCGSQRSSQRDLEGGR